VSAKLSPSGWTNKHIYANSFNKDAINYNTDNQGTITVVKHFLGKEDIAIADLPEFAMCSFNGKPQHCRKAKHMITDGCSKEPTRLLVGDAPGYLH